MRMMPKLRYITVLALRGDQTHGYIRAVIKYVLLTYIFFSFQLHQAARRKSRIGTIVTFSAMTILILKTNTQDTIHILHRHIDHSDQQGLLTVLKGIMARITIVLHQVSE